jgi:ABC-2 type transport system permease protein
MSGRPNVGLHAYVSVAAARQRALLQYRAAALAGVATQLFFGAIRLMVFAAFYGVAAATGAPTPMTFGDVVAYVWLGQALWALLPWNPDEELVQQVRSGGMALDLLRPLDLYAHWFARTFGYRVGRTLLRGAPIVLIAGLAFPSLGLGAWGLAPPPTLESALLFGASLLAAVLLSTAITMLLHVGLMHQLTAVGVQPIVAALVTLLSGMVIPLPLFPDFLQPLLRAQPMRGLCDVPYRIYTGDIAPPDALLEIVQQLGWLALLVWLGRTLLAAATRRVVIQGG